MPSSSADRSLFWFLSAGVVAVDLGTKLLAVTYLSPIPQPVLGRALQWQLVYNRGAAFGLTMGSASRWGFAVLGIIALLLVGVLVRATDPAHRMRLASLAMVCGGAVGNLVDRIRSPRGVVDFIDVGLAGFRWPTFNIADVAVVSGTALFVVGLLWKPSPPNATHD